MKEITATKFAKGNTKSAYDLVCTHATVKITSGARHDIIMVLATDYEDLIIELQQANKTIGQLKYEVVENEKAAFFHAHGIAMPDSELTYELTAT